MAKQLNVDLRFTANNAQAKQQIQDLQTALDKLMMTSSKSSSGLGITKDIAQATSEVAKLQAMLESSKSASGGLDLGKFNQSLAQGQVKISDYAKTLSSLGPQGDQAFAKLAKAIINAEVPLKRTNSLLKEFKTSLANTARWQLSSSMLHGFMGAVQSAYGYAQDLNESLNNIRIVTGQNIDQMARFAKEANRAAQALSTTTTEYTDASLIYYQQGLSDSEVATRTEVTIKMANAAGQSAKIVSDQLTAVWNNFYDGSKSLEYYADVMTALGAATASSTDEIAGGLEKFAAIGETIGLSYEYAASALATITSNTRQSEEVVGTSLKTIFARIQGLNLGETLEDGTSLNKYSEALEKVGISIFEQNGEIKKMDNILDEMAAKWGTLAKDQQIALAQTVAGVRQYTQLIALMDNWNVGDSDSMLANLDTAYNATGTLQEQADIYAESWEAAKDRVTAAAEEIYNQLLNDEFFIDLNNGFAGFLNIVSNTIDALGGLPGVLTVASSIMFKMFGKDMAQAIDDWGYNIKLRSKEGVQSLMELREQAKESLKTMYADNVDTGPVNSASQVAFNEYASLTDVVLAKQKELTAQGQMLSAENQKQVQYLLQTNEAYGEQAILSAKSLEAAEKQTRQAEMQLRYAVQKQNQNIKDPANKIDFKTTLKPQINEAQKAQMQYSSLYDVYLKLKQLQNKGLDSATVIQELSEMSKQAKAAGVDISHFDTVLKSLNSGDSIVVTLNAIESNLDDLALEALNTAETVKNSLTGMGMDGTQVDAILDQLIESWRQQGIVTADLAEKLKNIKVQGDEAAAAINKMQGPPPTVGQKFMAVANTISNIAMSISAVKGLIDTWNNDDMSFGEKLLSTFTTLGMVIPMVTTALTGNNLALLGSASASVATALGFDGVGIAATVAAGGVGALWAALWPIALVVAAIAAAIAILVVSIKAISNAYNKDAIAAEQAEKAASNLANAYNEAKQEYQDMIAAMDNYKSARDALDNLTEGTKEYEAALKEANRAALELINKYGLIEGQDYSWEGDQLVIKDDAIDRVSSAKEAAMDQAYAASQMASANAKAARAQANLTESRRDIRDDNGLGDGDRIWQGVVGGITAAIGVALAPATGGLSLAATALAANAAINADIEASKMDAAITKAVEAAKENQNLFDTKEVMAEALNIDINDTKLVDALWANQEEIKSLAQEMNAAEAAWKLAAQNSANEILNNNDIVQGSENAEEVMAAGGKMYGTAYDEAYNKYLSDAKSRGWFNTGNADSKAAFEEYAKKAGLNDLKNFKVTNYKGDGTVEYKYIDENGTEQKKLATAEEIAATLAAAEAAEKLGASAENLVKVFNSLDASGNAYDQAMKNFLSTGDFENSTRGESTGLIKQVDSSGDGTVGSAEATTYLGSKFGGDDNILSDEEAKQYGYTSAQAMIDAFTKELTNIDKAWDSIKLPDNIVGLDNMSLKTAQAIEHSINEINLGPAGVAAGEEYVKGINTMLSGLSEEDQTAALAQLANIDWSDWDAMDQAKKIMKEFGVEIDLTSTEWQKFASDMRIAGAAIPDFSGLKQDLIDITSILGKLEFGSIISDEDYQTLIAYNKEWAELFILQADGSRKFIGNSQQMLQSTRDQINAERKALAERKAVQEAFNDVKWQYTDASGNKVDVDWAEGAADGIQAGDISTARNLMNVDGATQAALETLGYDDATLEAIIKAAETGDENAKAQIAEMFNRMQAFKLEDLDLVDAELNEMMASTATSLTELMAMADDISAEAFDKQLSVLAQSASSLAELESIAAFGNGEIGISAEEYSQALMKLAGNFDNCTEEMERYQQTLQSGNEEQILAAESALKSSIRIGEAAEKYDLSAESLEAQTREIMIANGWGEEYAETAAQMAISNQRMNKGVEKLVKGWKNWSKILSSTETTSQDYADVLVELSDAVEDLVGWYGDLSLSSEFVSKNMKLIDKAATGDVNAIIQLGAEVAKYEVAQSQLNTTLANGLVSDGTINALQAYADKLGEGVSAADAFVSAQAGIQAGFDLIANNLERLQNGISLQEIFGGEEGLRQWVEQLNAYAAATGMTAQQMQAMLSSVGVTANVQTDYQEQEVTVPTYREQVTNVTYRRMPYQTLGLDGQTIFTGTTTVPEYTKAQVPGPPLTTTGFVEVASISMDGVGEAPGVPAPTFTGRQAPSKSAVGGNTGGGGGSSSAPKEPSKATKIDTTNKSEIVERYREVNDALDDLADEYEKASRSADRLWGENRLDALREQNELIKEQQKLLAQKQQQAQQHMQQDRADLQKVASQAGLTFAFDENGNITNYTSQMTALYEQLAAAENHYNSLSTGEDQDAYEETILDPLKDKISAIEEAIALYDESREMFEETGIEIEDLEDQLMQNNYNIIMEGLELKISVNEKDLEIIDYYLSKIEDDFYSMAEAAALMMDKNGSSQLSNYLANLAEYENAINELSQAYVNGDITEAMYHEGLEDVQSSILDNLSSLNELDKTMKEYYGETLEMARDELSKYTDQLEQQTAILEHYKSMMEILGKQMDYESMNIILQGQVETIENEMEVAKAAYELYQQQADQKKALLEEAIAREDTAAAEIYQKEWEAANEAAMEAQSDMLDKTEEWAQAMRDVVENELSGLAKSLEDALTGGTSFDYINSQLERAASLQEEYLTTTNQIYETNKLMRTAQQEIDKSTNLVAKQRLKDFIKETNQLQDKSKLSKYELEIQQAKYNLLLAEIALEDAQNAKSTVRLQRDAEGNFGYVYTADSTQLTKAQQELEDAQNELYNISLDGVNDYTEKYAQTMQEMYDTLTSITEAYYNGEIDSHEEYEAQMLAAQEYYYQKLEDYQDLYGIALEVDTRAIKDSWASGFQSMIYNTSTWKERVADYTKAAAISLTNWYNKVEEISNKTGLDNIANSVKNVTDKSEELRDKILEDDGVVDALYEELQSVSALTRQYAEYRSALQQTIVEYERLITQAKQLTQANREAIATSNAAMEAAQRVQEQNHSSSVLNNTSSTPSSTSENNNNNSKTTNTSIGNKYKATYSLQGKSNTLSGYASESAARAAAENAIQAAVNALTGITFTEKSSMASSAKSSISIARYDTGGYTGSWGPYGKIGILDEKELILDKNDTANFLASMEVLERILEMIDLQAVNSQLGGMLYTPSVNNSSVSQVVDQNVHIEASFPSVQDRYEIEEAFNTLINKASQYANRK